MGLTLHQLHTAFVLQQPQGRGRQCAFSGKPVGRIEHRSRLFAHRADHFAEHQPGLEDITDNVGAALR
jgi:hypothetical protein